MPTIKSANALIRCCHNEFGDVRPAKVVLIGNGAIQGGWEPLNRAIREYFPVPLSREGRDLITKSHDLAAHLLASASFTFRRLRSDTVARSLRSGRNKIEYKSEQKKYLDDFVRFRAEVARAYLSAHSEISVRDPPRQIASIIRENSTAVVTTNWDLLLWDDQVSIKNIVQLHGAVFDANSLIFPSEFESDEEVIREAFVRIDPDLSRDRTEDGFGNFLEMYCRGASSRHLSDASRCVLNWLDSASEIIAWGVACNSYDAELNSQLMLSTRIQDNKKLTVFNPDEKAARAIATMLRKSNGI